jgi:hypothetical protein
MQHIPKDIENIIIDYKQNIMNYSFVIITTKSYIRHFKEDFIFSKIIVVDNDKQDNENVIKKQYHEFFMAYKTLCHSYLNYSEFSKRMKNYILTFNYKDEKTISYIKNLCEKEGVYFDIEDGVTFSSITYKKLMSLNKKIIKKDDNFQIF